MFANALQHRQSIVLNCSGIPRWKVVVYVLGLGCTLCNPTKMVPHVKTICWVPREGLMGQDFCVPKHLSPHTSPDKLTSQLLLACP